MRDPDKHEILLTFYGDDFTGTTATAEALMESGAPTVIFTKPPTLSFLVEHFPRVKAVGVAGIARTLPVDKLNDGLPPIFEAMRAYQAPIFLYKVCSTFDSSSDIGNIGRAIEIGKSLFSSEFVPVLPAAPKLGRFTLFGHHFAALGQGDVFRLDRHPSMSNHPITPMNESDLRLHLAQQTTLKSGSINVLALEKGDEHIQMLIDNFVASSIPIIVMDCLNEQHITLACDVVWRRASSKKQIFFVGSQEVGYGMGQAWQKAGLLSIKPANLHDKDAVSKQPLLVISGSCAIVTGEQIRWALENGFGNIEVQPQQLLSPVDRQVEQQRVIKAALAMLQQGQSVIAHTAMGADDPRTDLLEEKTSELSLTSEIANEMIGNALGEITLEILQASRVRRLVVAGGDTSGRIQKYLDIQALQVAKPIGIGAPLCYMYSRQSSLNGLEIAFKGGQTGSIDYFGKAQALRVPEFEMAALGQFESRR